MRLGIIFRINEMTRLEKAVTTITASAITMEGFICTVTANAEQMPNTCTVIGLLSFSGSYNSRLFFGENKGSFGAFIFAGAVGVAVLILIILIVSGESSVVSGCVSVLLVNNHFAKHLKGLYNQFPGLG